MPLYKYDKTLDGGGNLAAGLDHLRLARYLLANEQGHMQQMASDTQMTDRYGFTSADATNAKNELLSDIQKLLSDAAGVNSAVVQMLNQFG